VIIAPSPALGEELAFAVRLRPRAHHLPRRGLHGHHDHIRSFRCRRPARARRCAGDQLRGLRALASLHRPRLRTYPSPAPVVAAIAPISAWIINSHVLVLPFSRRDWAERIALDRASRGLAPTSGSTLSTPFSALKNSEITPARNSQLVA